jgi:Uncharacterized protein conserved in bacteria
MDRRATPSGQVEVRRIGKAILRSEVFQRAASFILGGLASLTYKLNRDVAQSTDAHEMLDGEWPVIFAMWHGQQLLIPYAAPRDQRFVSLVSRSADAEINARVILRAGHDVIRGSGGRVREQASSKGGVSAMIAMRDALRAGTNVVMVADISKGAPRQAGEGVVRLAKISGRPVVPMAIATSNRYVIARSWDKTTINLPFGRRCLKLGGPVYVSPDAGEAELQQARAEVTRELNRITEEAHAAVEKRA